MTPMERLRVIAQQRPTVVRIADTGSIEATYARVLEVIDAPRR